jgi:hypothetical protein
MAPEFVIVGSGRSGSGYISRVLTEAGVPTGHEEWWNPFDEHRPDIVGDSSWCAVPDLPNFDGVILHQVRHPLSVVASHMKRWSRHDAWWSLKSSLIRRPLTGDDKLDAMASWVDINKACEEANPSLTWQVEEVSPLLLMKIAETAGQKIRRPAAFKACKTVPNNYNSKEGDRVSLAWWDIPESELKEEMKEMASRYGYHVPGATDE